MVSRGLGWQEGDVLGQATHLHKNNCPFEEDLFLGNSVIMTNSADQNLGLHPIRSPRLSNTHLVSHLLYAVTIKAYI
jgi:hypothetical protein